MEIEKIKEDIAGKLATLDALVRCRNAFKLYDINKHCEVLYCDLLNVVLKNKHLGLKLVSANTPANPNCKGIDLIDKKRRVMVQVTSNGSNQKVKSTFANVNDPKEYGNYTLYFMFVAGTREAIDFRVNRPPKFIKCSHEHLLDSSSLIKQLDGRNLSDYKAVQKILHDQLDKGGNGDMGVEACFSFIYQIAELYKFTCYVKSMCEELPERSTAKRNWQSDKLKSSINEFVDRKIPKCCPDFVSARRVWARNTRVYANLCIIDNLVFELNCNARDEISFVEIDVREVRDLTEKLLGVIYDTIKMMSKDVGVSEDVAFTELTLHANAI